MTPVDSPSDLLACVAAFGRSLDESFDPGRSLSEFSARTQRLVPHDYMVIALLEDRGQTYSLFAEYAVRGSLPGDDRRYTTAFERGARVAAESFPLAPVFGGEPQLIGDVTTDDRFREATACREALDEAGLRAVLAVPLFAGGRVGGALVVMSTTAGLYTEAHASPVVRLPTSSPRSWKALWHFTASAAAVNAWRPPRHWRRSWEPASRWATFWSGLARPCGH